MFVAGDVRDAYPWAVIAGAVTTVSDGAQPARIAFETASSCYPNVWALRGAVYLLSQLLNHYNNLI